MYMSVSLETCKFSRLDIFENPKVSFLEYSTYEYPTVSGIHHYRRVDTFSVAGCIHFHICFFLQSSTQIFDDMPMKVV